jgi:PAS domain S-box-containing protein
MLELQLLDPVNYTLNPYAIAPCIIGFLSVVLGIAVLLRERGSFISFLFFTFALTGGLWLICYLGIFSARSSETALWWCKTQLMLVAFIPSITYLFTLVVTRRINQHRLLAFLGLVVSALFGMGIQLTDLYVVGTYEYPWGYFTRLGPVGFSLVAFFYLVLAASFRHLWTEHLKTKSRTQKHRFNFFAINLTIGYMGSVDYLPAFGIPIFPSGYLAVFVFLLMTAYAIKRYQLVTLTPAFAAKQILKTMADTLLVLDSEGVIRVANHAACRMFGKEEKELVGKPLWLISGNLLPKNRLQRVLRSGAIQRYQTLYSSQQAKLLLDISVSSVPNQENEAIGAVCIVRDITSQRLKDFKETYGNAA